MPQTASSAGFQGRRGVMAVALAAGAAGASVVAMVQLPAFAELFGVVFAVSLFLLICAAEARQ